MAYYKLYIIWNSTILNNKIKSVIKKIYNNILCIAIQWVCDV